MITQFVRCYVHPTNGTIDHVYCNDQGIEPDDDPLGTQLVQYDIIDYTMDADEYIRPTDIKDAVQYVGGAVSFTKRPQKAINELSPRAARGRGRR